MDLLHVRVIAPTASTPRIEALLAADDAVTHVIVLPGVARSPAGDVVQFDVVRESNCQDLWMRDLV